jgi:hypothetical protein
MVKGLDDGDAGVRDSCAKGLGIILRVVGEKSWVSAMMDRVDGVKMAKVLEYFKDADVRCKGKSAPVKKVWMCCIYLGYSCPGSCC